MISRAAVLADLIESAIVEGDVPVGSRLGTKEDLRRRYDVAYGTLNEALRMLQQRGFLTSRTGPGGGLFASTPTARLRLSHLILGFHEGGTLTDCAVVRHALEEPIAIDAALSRTQTDLDDLAAIIHRMGVASNDPRAYLFANWHLHRRIAQICRNRVLGNLYCTLLDAHEAELQDVVPSPEFGATVNENLTAHRQIVAAVASGSPEHARRAIEAHEAFFSMPTGGHTVIPAQALPETIQRSRVPHLALASAR